jgi:D-amino-acid oxidase
MTVVPNIASERSVVTLKAKRHKIDTLKYSRGIQYEYPEISLSTDSTPLLKPTKESKHILILGGGVSGLLIAWMLLDEGYRVTIIADDWAWTKDFEKSRMTSQVAGALWEFPPGGCGLTEIESPGKGWAATENGLCKAMSFTKSMNRYSTPMREMVDHLV